MFCTKCGNRMDEGAKFCGSCGTPRNELGVGQPQCDLVADQSAPVQTYAAPMPAPVAAAKPSNKRKTVVAVALIAVVAAIVFLFANRSGSSNSRLIKSTSYNADGTISSWIEYTYEGNTRKGYYHQSGNQSLYSEAQLDKNDRIIEETQFLSYHEDGTPWYTANTKNEYDNMGRVVRQQNTRIYDHDVSTSEYLYTYDSDGQRISDTSYWDGEIIARTLYEYEYEYGTNGKPIASVGYDDSGIVSQRATYNSDGQIVRRTYYTREGLVRQEIVTEYNDNGRTARSTLYQNREIFYTTVSEYNADNQIQKTMRFDETGNILNWEEHEYSR